MAAVLSQIKDYHCSVESTMIRKAIPLTLLVSFLFAPALAAKESDVFKKAVKYYFQRKYEMAEILLQESIKKNPENFKAYSYLGDIYLMKKKYKGALNLYRKAVDLKPENAENYFRIGQVYYYQKLGDLALENFNRALSLDKTLVFVYYHLGLCQLMLKRDKYKTINNWETFLRLAPEDPQYESIRRVIELLKDPNFKIPPPGSDVSIEEALLLGGTTLSKSDRKAAEKKAGNEKKKTRKKLEGLYLDDDDL